MAKARPGPAWSGPTVLDLAAVVLAFPLARASLGGLRASAWLFVALYVCVAGALVLAARIGWRGFAKTGRALPASGLRTGWLTWGGREDRPRAGPGARGTRGHARAEVSPDVAALARRASVPALFFGARPRLDAITYTPGDPNVLSMTKFLDGVREVPGQPVARAGPLADRAARILRTDRGDETVLRIAGVLEAGTVGSVGPALDAVAAGTPGHVRLDLSELERLDGAGVRLIAGFARRCRAAGGVVVLSGLRDQPLALFRLLRLDRSLA